MAGFVKLERWKVTEMRNGCVFKTKKLEAKWFEIGKGPKTDEVDSEGYFWVPALDYHFGRECPKE